MSTKPSNGNAGTEGYEAPRLEVCQALRGPHGRGSSECSKTGDCSSPFSAEDGSPRPPAVFTAEMR